PGFASYVQRIVLIFRRTRSRWLACFSTWHLGRSPRCRTRSPRPRCPGPLPFDPVEPFFLLRLRTPPRSQRRYGSTAKEGKDCHGIQIPASIVHDQLRLHARMTKTEHFACRTIVLAFEPIR